MERWITANQLLKRWSAGPSTIFKAVEDGLSTYREWTQGRPKEVDMKNFVRHFSRMHDSSALGDWFPAMLFKMSDVESFEDDHSEDGGGMTAKDRRNYGRLKAERENFTDAISAAVKGLMHCQDRNPPIRKAEFKIFIQEDYPGLPDTSIGEIWRAIPGKYKLSGRPRLAAKK
ncbi:hypothetical protein DSCA_02000 [Desulfosarcina alkanivorans]|uniref:Uncharacterized protein n=2 Tax=Desulfosarcina alkanivorans TaxID=571177 RepID=A0A5K7YE51_9BACT|nr:hypothetical protein DSCA_02000 [Desulfosarcina alkanivorans]